MSNNLDLSSLNTEFDEIEEKVKKQIGSNNYVVNETRLSTLQLLTRELDSLVRKKIENVYLLSVALLIDDFFQISFPTIKRASLWAKYVLNVKDGGIISKSCESNTISVYSREQLLSFKVLPQRTDFLNSKVQSYSVAPIYIGFKNIGCVILSLEKEPNSVQEQNIISFLSVIRKRMEWIMYSEFVRVNSLLEKCMFLQYALDSVDEYQSYHSVSVSKLAVLLGFAINMNKNYIAGIKRSYPGFAGVDIFQIRIIGLMHDIGKVNMSEFEDFQSLNDQCNRALHPYFSYVILSKCGLSEQIAEAAGNHQESVLSTGIPFGLSLGKEKMSVESQIVKFADIIDSSIRERDGGIKHDEKFIRDCAETAMNAVNANKSDFDKYIFETLKAAYYGIIEGEQPLMFYKNFDESIMLTGIKYRKKGSIVLKFHNKEIDFSSMGKNKWAVIYASYEEIPNQIFETSEKIHIGLYYEKRKKELSYNFCEELFKNINAKPLICAFITHSMSRSGDFQKLIDSCIAIMSEYLKSSSNSNRWRLLRFNERTRKWK